MGVTLSNEGFGELERVNRQPAPFHVPGIGGTQYDRMSAPATRPGLERVADAFQRLDSHARTQSIFGGPFMAPDLHSSSPSFSPTPFEPYRHAMPWNDRPGR